MSVELLNGRYDTFVFSGGEVHVRIHEANPLSHIKAVIGNSEDVIRLLMLADALKRMNCIVWKLDIPYFPYARQDRVCNAGEALSVKVMADLINSIGAEKVVLTDPHSDVLPALVNNCELLDVRKLGLMDTIGDKLVICPDAGAEKRILKLGREYVMATKVRDIATGEIKETRLYGDVSGRDCIIVDDICDGGRTFVELAKSLRAGGANSVDLYVSHGIFSKGMGVFENLINGIYHFDYKVGCVQRCL